MIDLEKRLSEHYPAWFEGPKALLSRPLLRGLGRFSRLDEANAFIAAHPDKTGLAFVDAVIAHLRTRYTVDQVERERIPADGRVLLVANHPAGVARCAGPAAPAPARCGATCASSPTTCCARLPAIRDLMLPVRILGGTPVAGKPAGDRGGAGAPNNA